MAPGSSVETYSQSTVRDLLSRSELGLKVCCGRDHLDRAVRWTHVTELPDPTPYLREAELVLTNGLWLDQGVSPRDYVDRLATSRAAGLMFGLLRERPQIPEDLVTASEQAGLVLVTLPVEVPFTAVSQAMAELQAESRLRELSREVDRSNALAQAVIEGVDEGGVLRLLTSDYALPVALVDLGGHVLASEGVEPQAIDGEAVAAVLAGPSRAEVTFSDGTVASVFEMRALDEPEAALVCVRPRVDLSTAECSAIKQTVGFLALDMTRRHASQAIESRFASELLDMINEPSRSKELVGRLRSFGIDPDRPLAVLSVVFADGEPSGEAELGSAIRRVLLRLGLRAVVPQDEDDSVAIVGGEDDDGELLSAGHEVVASAAREWPERPVLVGISNVVDAPQRLWRGLLEAREARRMADRSRAAPAVGRFERIGSHGMLMAMHDDHMLREFAAAVLGPLREHDRLRQTELERTLRTYLQLDGRLSDSAAALFVHVNTLRNRLARIEELTGRTLSSTDDRVDLYLALGVNSNGHGSVLTYRALAAN